MIRRGQSGGLINLGSFLQEEDRHNIRTASSSMQKVALKEGCQSLYADPEDVFKKYKDFDIAKAMSERKDSKLLWVRARAIDADVDNANGDYFSKDELLKEIEVNGKKIPAYKTFEGVPLYTNHKNDDIEEAKGMVVYADWDDEENCVWCTFFIDEEAYPHIARGIRQGYMHDVSMGCQVESGTCSVCGHKALTEKDYCTHMEKYKGKVPPGSSKKAYEINHGLKFIELSVVGDGAFESCSIEEIYDVDEILDKALNLEKRANAIRSDILVASSYIPSDPDDRKVYEDCLRQVTSTSTQLMKLAQTAGTLVGGQVMANEGSGQNTTVSKILEFLGINGTAGLNILDMLNLALNFLEVTVMNLFARKDNIDLAHVGKITKSMADLQATMQDMLDDGVESGAAGGGGQQANTPLNQGALGQQQAPQMPPPNAAAGAGGDYAEAGNVGRAMAPPTQNQAFMGAPLGIGGGIVASNKNKRIILWDAPEEEEGRKVIYASVKRVPKSKNSLVKLGENLTDFAKVLGVQSSTKAIYAEDSQTSKKISGGNNMNVFEQQFTANRRKKQEAAVATHELHVDDIAKQNRITLSSNGTVKAYHNGVRLAWEPELTDDQLEKIAGGKTEYVAAEILTEFKHQLREAGVNGRTIEAWKDPNTNTGEVMENQVKELRTGTDTDVKENLLKDADEYSRQGEDNRTREETLKDVRKGTPESGKVKEQMLKEDAGLYGWSWKDTDLDVREALIEDARKTVPTEVIELQLKAVRDNSGSSSDVEVVSAAVNAMASAVVTAGVTPSEVVEAMNRISSRNDFDKLVVLASLGTKQREVLASRADFFGNKKPLTIEAAIYDAVGSRVSEKINAADLADTLAVLSADSRTVDAVTKLAKTKIDNAVRTSGTVKISKEDRIKAALASQLGNTEELAREHVKAAISAFTESALETRVHPKEIVAEIAEIDESDLAVAVETARTASAIKSRMTLRERDKFYGNTRVASKVDVNDSIVGWLADYADSYKIDARTIVKAAKRIASSPVVATNLVTKVINNRFASIEVTTEKSDTTRFNCRIEDLDGIDVKSDNFNEEFRTKAMDILSQSGFTCDPNTFNLSDVNVSADGNVTASITSRVSRSFKVDGITAPAPIEVPSEAADANVQSSFPNQEPSLEISGTVQAPVDEAPEVFQEGNNLMTASVKAYRKAKREEILNRYAQMGGAPPMSGGMGGAPMGGTTPSPLEGALDAGNQEGVSAFSGATPEVTEDPTGADKGTKQPWGTICPQCGSQNVDVANGEGNCQDCSAQMEYTFTVQVKPGNDEEKQAGETPAPEEAPLGDDTGLGAATAPAPVPPAGGGAPPMGGGAPGVMAQATWIADSNVFVRLAQKGYDMSKEKALPVGFICPSCGNREVVKSKRMTFCHSCGTISTTKIAADTTDPSKIRCSIKWLS